MSHLVFEGVLGIQNTVPVENRQKNKKTKTKTGMKTQDGNKYDTTKHVTKWRKNKQCKANQTT